MVSKDVCSAIVKLLLPQYISFPSGAALREIVDGFEDEYGFPQCAGAVDGSHIPIISPQECPAITTVKVGTPSFYKEPLTTEGVSWMSM